MSNLKSKHEIEGTYISVFVFVCVRERQRESWNGGIPLTCISSEVRQTAIYNK